MADKGKKLESIDTVIDDERVIINKRRKRLYPTHNVSDDSATNLIGLALSGGGIRSAVTNLGVLYEMSRVGLFKIVDYLSTVSGGGYIGCCVSSLLSLKKPGASPLKGNAVYTYKNGDSDPSLFTTDWHSFPFRDLPFKTIAVDRKISETCSTYGKDNPFCRTFTSRDQVFHLRDRASYLIPSSLPFGSHVTRALGSVSATTILSLAWFFSLLICITILYMLNAFPAWNMKTLFQTQNPPALSIQIPSTEKQETTATAVPNISQAEESGIVSSIMKRASKTMRSIKVKLIIQTEAFATLGHSRTLVLLLGIVWGFCAPFCMHWRGESIKAGQQIISEDKEYFVCRKQLKCISLSTIVLLFTVLWVSFWKIKGNFFFPDPRLLFPAVFSIGCLTGSLIVLCLVAADLLHFSFKTDQDRSASEKKSDSTHLLEWNRISRGELSLCSGIFIYCLTGSCVFAILPAFILSGNAGYIALLQAVLILGLRYYLSGTKKKITDKKQGKFTAFSTKISTWTLGLIVPFVIFLAVTGIASFLGPYFFGTNWPVSIESGNLKIAVTLLAGGFFCSTALSLLNFNNISPHVFYKDRLSETFLLTFMHCFHQDKNNQNTHQTQMDSARNSVEMNLTDLHGHETLEQNTPISAARGPYLLMNATLNLTAARDLQGYRRQSEIFLLSKCYTGSERTGYIATNAYNPPIELGRAMTISGAALTSVMGTQGSLAESFACTILGIRLGYWLRNPIDMAKTLTKRSWNWKNLYYELFRYTDSRDSHVYLSDGGHCGDNLGLLALLQRKTKLIIASDAECDPEHVFNSLNNSIRRAYVDYNIKIHISLDELTPDDNGLTRKHYAIGRIIYPDRPWQKSWLLIIKNTLTGQESSPIRNYLKKSPDFPHETTADQFFTEEQFEVYRSLGREACMEIWRENIHIFRSEKWLHNPWLCIDEFCQTISAAHHNWDDIIKALWLSERGDFNTWKGFLNTIIEVNLSKKKDNSIMVKQLHELHRWLLDNKQNFQELQQKFDIPRTWSHFKDIRFQMATKS
jgi:hypothetical protein